jgi:hypothetical protein
MVTGQVVPEMAIKMSFFDVMRTAMAGRDKAISPMERLAAGGAAGGIAQLTVDLLPA